MKVLAQPSLPFLYMWIYTQSMDTLEA
ncbi:hypothetical protein M8C21_018560 [Ambrosia artemisiifolia]|uniref:Uncharacterized protein n=1 Tax=Ambrosia artemisiifolia TaxID=4212 RepID=A0AAD5CVS8_AMBAR|nr:hypothetical protein M8C21_018560 [Ambrosia artemisiifolia]